MSQICGGSSLFILEFYSGWLRDLASGAGCAADFQGTEFEGAAPGREWA